MAEKESFVDLLKKLGRSVSSAKSALQRAQEAFQALIKGKTPKDTEETPSEKKPINPSKAKQSAKKEQYTEIQGLKPNHIGKLLFFDYDPKWKKKLPYYDRFPLVIPISISSDRFIGLNLHYLPPLYRAMLFDAINKNVYKKKNITEKEIVQLNYSMLSRISRTKLYIPCVRQYLYSHVEDGYTLIPSSDWKTYVPMSTPKFEKKSKEYIWKDSFRKINKY